MGRIYRRELVTGERAEEDYPIQHATSPEPIIAERGGVHRAVAMEPAAVELLPSRAMMAARRSEPTRDGPQLVHGSDVEPADAMSAPRDFP